MNRHSLRWTSLVFGLLFLACVGCWAVWRQELLTTRELSLTASTVLIALGLVGVVATLRQARPSPADVDRTDTDTDTHHPLEGDQHDQTADPYP